MAHRATFENTALVSAVMLQSTREKIMMRSWLREPLVHFLVLGSVIFAIDAVVAPGAGDARVIRIE